MTCGSVKYGDWEEDEGVKEGPNTSEKSKSSVGVEQDEDLEGGIVRVSFEARILCKDLLFCDVETIFVQKQRRNM